MLGDYTNLSKSTDGARKKLTGFEKSTQKMAKGIKMAFAGLGIGLGITGITAIYDALVDLGKEAAADEKSLRIFNKTLTNTWKATEATKTATDEYISSLAMLTGIADDELRPAYARIARTQKDAKKTNDLFRLSLDVAIGTGKDFNQVSAAMAKYLMGNNKAFNKIAPEVIGANDAIGLLRKNYAGMADEANPFERINQIFGEFKEKLGKAILPMVKKFADYLAGPEAQNALDKMAQKFSDMFEWINSKEGQKTISEWYTKAKKLVGELVKIVEGLAAFMAIWDVKTKTENRSNELDKQNPNRWSAKLKPGSNWLAGMPGLNQDITKMPNITAGTKSNAMVNNIVINVANPKAVPEDIAKALKGYLNRLGRKNGGNYNLGSL
jgi:hypothetical protein